MQLQPAGQPLAQGFARDRFGEVIGHAGCGAERFVPTRAVRAQGDNGQLLTVREFANAASRFQAVEHRHFAVHQDDIEGAVTDRVDRFLPVGRHGG